MRLPDYCGSKVAISAPDDPRSRKQPTRGTGKPGHNGRTGPPTGAGHPDDPRSQRTTPPENPPEAKTRRETDGPRHRDTPRTGNSKTDAPQHLRKFHVTRSFHVTATGAPRCTAVHPANRAYETAQGSDGADVR
jgi:hypothetical protein